MKGIRITELLANIRADLVAFLSIAMFVSLGAGLFLGVQWAAFALRKAADETIERGDLYDVSVDFPYGITEDGIRQIESIEGVTDVECGYISYVMMNERNTHLTLGVQSLPEKMDAFTSIIGNLPMQDDEIALLRFAAQEMGLDIGSTITLVHDATNEDGTTDPDGMATLNTDTYTVTALVDSSRYLYKNLESLGVSNIGSGSINCIGYVLDSSFDATQFRGGYPHVSIRCASLRGVSAFSDEYKQGIAPIMDKLTELGATLATARYNEISEEAQAKIDDAQAKIDEGTRQLEEGRQQIESGEQQLKEGRQQIESGKQQLVETVSSGAKDQAAVQAKLDEAYRKLADGQAKYDAGLATYNTAMDAYNQANNMFNAARPEYDTLMTLLDQAQPAIDGARGAVDVLNNAYTTYQLSPVEENWEQMLNSYDSAASDLSSLSSLTSGIARAGNAVGNALSMPLSLSGIAVPLSQLTDIRSASIIISNAYATLNAAQDLVNSIKSANVTISGTTIWLTNIPAGLQQINSTLSSSKAELDAAKTTLDQGWDEYNKGKAQYDSEVAAAQEKLDQSQKDLEKGEATLNEKTKELEEGKATLNEKTKELEEGKATLADVRDRFDQLIHYEWVVSSRRDNAALVGFSAAADMMDNVKWAMSSLFILVGMFVCYSAISRLVHEHITQIGTKKALGFHDGEIAALYLGFSGLSVLLGILICLAISMLVVQGVINPVATRQFTIEPYPPHFNALEVLALGSIELALILLATWVAIRSLLKRDAVELLRGESTANTKEHFYERTRLWSRMSLFSQTVVNNCVNDKRRVTGTLIGIIGCTMLIVVAVTLNRNVADSLTRHYDNVISYDAITYLDDASEQKSDMVALALYKHGITSSPVFLKKLQVRLVDGSRNLATFVVPTSEEAFRKFFNVVSTDGTPANIENGGLWISANYAEHQGAKVGDEVTVTEFSGKTHTFKVAGIYNHYLLRFEFVLSQMEYRQAFGTKPEPNALLTNVDGADIDKLSDALKDIEGYNSIEDDYESASHAYSELNSILTTVVLVFLLLSALMALMVLLNLNVMCIEEKKRELIVLMINGFSAKDAKAYIYRDSIVLTVIGVLFGIVLGAVMGAITVWALQPTRAYWIKDLSIIAAVTGAAGAAVFATGVLIWALRRIPRFDLTDINRF